MEKFEKNVSTFQLLKSTISGVMIDSSEQKLLIDVIAIFFIPTILAHLPEQTVYIQIEVSKFD